MTSSCPACCTPRSCARVLSVDVSAARALPGVVAALTGAELEAMTVPGPDALMALMGWAGPTPEFTLLATDKVRFVGDPVAIVVAESRYLAEDGCELVEVEYDDLPPVVDAAFALDPGSPPLFANLGDNIARPHSRSEHGDVSVVGIDERFESRWLPNSLQNSCIHHFFTSVFHGSRLE